MGPGEGAERATTAPSDATRIARLAVVAAGVVVAGAGITWFGHRSHHPKPTVRAGTSTASSSVAGGPTTTQPAPPLTRLIRVGTRPAGGTPASITLAFSGDLLPHGPVNAAAENYGRASGVTYDYAPMLAPLRPILAATDLSICHLEVPVAPTPGQITTYPTFGSPPELVAGAKSAGYEGCDTVSNHALDKGVAGIRATLDALDLERMGHAGSARTEAESKQVMIYDVRGVKVAHLAYTYGFNGYRPPDEPWAANEIDVPKILADAHRARAAGADLVVVSLHWGTDGMVGLDALQRRVAPELARSPDIDLLIGCHAHRVQEVQRIDGKYVVFGMGNELSNQHLDLEKDGLLVRATATRGANGRWSVTGLQAIPTWMDTTDWKVLPVTQTLAAGTAPSPAIGAALRASYARTVAAITAGGKVPGLTVDPLPA